MVGLAIAPGGNGSWVSPSTLAALGTGGDRFGSLLELQLADRAASGAFVDDVRRRYRPDQVEAWDWRQDRQDVIDRTSTSSVVLGSASLAALLAVGFIVANAIGGRILASRRDIGLLKAAGFTPGGVTSLFVVENLILAGAASIVGTAIGIALSPLMLQPTANLLGTPRRAGCAPSRWRPASWASSPWSASSPRPAWRAGRLGVLEAIALGRTTVSTKPSRAARAAAALRLPPAVVLGVKDAFASRSRAAMTIASLALTMATVVMALGTEATYRPRHPGLLAARQALRAARRCQRLAPARTRALLAAQSAGSRARRRSAGTTASVPGSPVDVWARALGGDYQRRPYAVRDGRMVAGPGEAIVGRGLLDALHLKVGDRLPLEADGARLDLRIVGRYVEPDNDGADGDLRPPLGASRPRSRASARSSTSCSCATAPTRTRCRRRSCAPRPASSTSR